MITRIELFLPADGPEIDMVDLAREFDIDDVAVYVGVFDGRPIIKRQALVYSLWRGHDRIRADQDRAAGRIAGLLGLDEPIDIHPVCRPTKSAAAQELAGLRKRAAYTCQACGQFFEAVARGGKLEPRYCSARCRMRARRAKS